MADSPAGTSRPFGSNYLNPVRADEEALDPRLHAVGDAGRVGRSGLRSSRKDNTTSAPRRARAQAKLLLKRDATIGVDDEGRPGVFAVCSAEGRQWRKASKLPLICSGLKADPEGDRLCWFGAGPVLARIGGEGPIGWLRSWRQGQAF